MLIKDIFETRIEEKIDPVIKVGERRDEKKLAGEISSYVITPTIESYLDDFLEHYTDTYRTQTTEIGVWISGYFGSGKSYLAKINSLLIENRTLDAISAIKRFESRIPSDAPHRTSILRSLTRIPQCDTQVLAFNLNTLADSKNRPLPSLLLSQYYQHKGYSPNFLYARVIEAELDKYGKLPKLHATTEQLTNKKWEEVQKNPAFYSKHLYQAAYETAPEIFSSPEDVAQALKNAEKGELFNVQFLVRTILDDLKAKEATTGKQSRLVLVMDEAGQWIEDDTGRLAQLQALVEEAAIKGQGKIWIFVTTHADMSTIYQNARAIKADMKKIEGRFRFKFSLTTENIELVLEDRIFKKKLAGKSEVSRVYNENPGVLRDLGQLAGTNQKLPECSEDRFVAFYPFLPYHIHLIPEIVKSLRSAGGRGEQLSGSTRTLLAITQDILRSGRRNYLNAGVGEIVSFDEVYNNLAGEGEINPDVRRELSRIQEVVPKDATEMTRRIAEVLYLIREINYIPRTIDNLSRLLIEHTNEDLSTIINRIKPELDKLVSARLVAKIGEEYEFLTGERRTFEEEVAEEKNMKWGDLEAGLGKFATVDLLGFTSVPFKGAEFPVKIFFDDNPLNKDGYIEIKISSPLSALKGTKISDLENESLHPEKQQTIFVLCDRITSFDEHLKYYIAMRKVIDSWKGDPHKSEEARKLASERESNDLEKLRQKVLEGIRGGIKHAHIVFRGSGRTVSPKADQTPGEALRLELASFWPILYSKFEKVPVRIVNEQRAIIDVLKGAKSLPDDVKKLKLFDKSGQLDQQSPLLDAIRIFLSTRQSANERTLGKDIIGIFSKPEYGWDPNAVRVGIAALVRFGAMRIEINKKPYANPDDQELQDAIRVSRSFDKVELILEETEIDTTVLTEVRTLLIRLTQKRKIDETPAALSAEMEVLGKDILRQTDNTIIWAEPAGFPLPGDFKNGREVIEKILELSNPSHRVKEIHLQKDKLDGYVANIRSINSFIEKWKSAFLEMRDFSNSLKAIEHLLPEGGTSKLFLDNWKTANDSSSIATDSVWKDLQDAKATASLELDKLLLAWREEARKIAQDALDHLPQEMAVRGLPAQEIQESLASPLNKFIANLNQENEVSRVATLPDRARNLDKALENALLQETRKLKPLVTTRKVQVIQLAEIIPKVRIQNEEQWNQVRDRLDKKVKDALGNGKDVEFN